MTDPLAPKPPSGLVPGLSNGRLLLHTLAPPLVIGLCGVALVLFENKFGPVPASATLPPLALLALLGHGLFFGVSATVKRRRALGREPDAGAVVVGMMMGLVLAGLHTMLALTVFFAGCMCLARPPMH